MKKGVVLNSLLVVSFILLFCGCLLEPMHEHTFSSDWSSDANYHWHAATCEHTDQVKDKATHAWDSGIITTEATHTSDGVKTYTCTVCGQTKTEVIPAQADAHTFSKEWTSDETHHWHAATCEHADAKGSYEAHSWENPEITKQPTCTEDGLKLFTCKCGATKEEIIPSGHSFSDEWTSDDTYHWHAASCEHEDQISDKAEHSWDDGVVSKEPTHLEKGIRIYTCIVCGKQKDEAIPEIEGHTYSSEWSFDITYHWHVATCGHDLITDKEEHVLNDDGDCTICNYVNIEGLFNITPKGVLTVKEGCQNKLPTSLGIPSEVKGITVTSIGTNAFKNCIYVTEITMPDSVTSIGNYAFSGCTSLTEINIPESVTSIGNHAFSYCTGLTEIAIAFSITSIGEYAFQNWTEDQTIEIVYGGFSGTTRTWEDCSAIIHVSIPTSISKIASCAFYNCKGLASITIPDSIKSMEEGAFFGCTNLVVVDVSNISSWCEISFNNPDSNPLSYAQQLYVSGEPTEGLLIIPSDVTSIGELAFVKCTSITGLVIPDSVTNIRYNAFSGCSGLTEITIPESVTSIGNYAFSGCTGLTEITIPESVTSIGNYAFSNCTSVNEITIPQSVSAIGINAFAGWNGNQTINVNYGGFSKSISSSGSIWDSCHAKVIVSFPDSVTIIGECAFKNCIGLSEITIPSTIERIDGGAFWGCTGISSIIIPKTVKRIERAAFYGLNNTQTIKIDYDGFTGSGYPNSTWYNCNATIELSFADSVASIGNEAFRGCTGLTEITIPESVTSIGNFAFSGCTGLTEITIPESVTSIGNYAFNGCTGLTEITIPESVTSIGSDAFNGCTGLTSMTIRFSGSNVYLGYLFGASSYEANNSYIPKSLKKITVTGAVICSGAFYGCSGLEEVTICDSVSQINYHAFYGCTGLTKIILPSSVWWIDDWAFKGCTGLTKITIPSSTTIITGNIFDGCLSLTSIEVSLDNEKYLSEDGVLYNKDKTKLIRYPIGKASSSFTIPSSVTEIGSHAFNECTGLTKITIPSSVIEIGSSAFVGCTGLTKIIIPSSVTSKFGGVFDDCTCEIIFAEGTTSIQSYSLLAAKTIPKVTIPSSVSSIGNYAFYNCTGLMDVIFCGTKTQWAAVSKGESWAFSVPATVVHCSDGDIEL